MSGGMAPDPDFVAENDQTTTRARNDLDRHIGSARSLLFQASGDELTAVLHRRRCWGDTVSELPQAMIQAAVEAVQVWRKEWLARVVAEPSVPSAELQRNGNVAMVEAILAAALSVCDVREEFEARANHADGGYVTCGWWADRGYTDRFVDRARRSTATLISRGRRLVITTPATEVSDVD